MSLGKMKIIFALFFVPKFHLMISYLELYCEKVDKDEVSYNEGTLHFFSYDRHIFHIPKIIFGVIRTLIIKLDLHVPAGIRRKASTSRKYYTPKVSLSATALQWIYRIALF